MSSSRIKVLRQNKGLGNRLGSRFHTVLRIGIGSALEKVDLDPGYFFKFFNKAEFSNFFSFFRLF